MTMINLLARSFGPMQLLRRGLTGQIVRRFPPGTDKARMHGANMCERRCRMVGA